MPNFTDEVAAADNRAVVDFAADNNTDTRIDL